MDGNDRTRSRPRPSDGAEAASPSHSGLLNRGAWRLRTWLVVLVVSIVTLAVSRTARADDLDELLAARDLYNNTEYEDAIGRLETLINRQPPAAPPYREAARKYLVASLILTNQRERAVSLLEGMLRENPELQFSTRDFSGVVTQLVDATRSRIGAELEIIRRQQTAAIARAADERRIQTGLLLARLGQERVTYQVSRAWMFIPFGVGQFVNRQYAWGAAFTTVQAASLATAITTFAVYQNLGLPGLDPTRTTCHESTCTGLVVTNVAAWSLFGVALVAGILQANLAFVPERTEYRPRPVSPDIRRLLISGGPTENGVILGASLRF